MRRVASAVAAIALIAGAAQAQGNGKSNASDRQDGGRPAAAAMQAGGKGNGPDNGQGAPMAAAMRGNHVPDRGAGASMASSMREASARSDGNARLQGNGNAMREQRARPAQAGKRAKGKSGPGASGSRGNGDGRRQAARSRGDANTGPGGGPDLSFLRAASRSLIAGCPPGLAGKNPPCEAPGLARNAQRRLFALDRPDWWGLSGLDDGRYVYGNGYLLRLGPDGGIAGYVPLLGGALALGNAWPSFYDPVRLPEYYTDYYNLGPSDAYRYADNVIYRVDPETAAITSIAALLAGDDFVIGQPAPPGYDVYNVPYGYRDRYHDTADALYRYSDGYIYQIDPETRLVAAAIELLAS